MKTFSHLLGADPDCCIYCTGSSRLNAFQKILTLGNFYLTFYVRSMDTYPRTLLFTWKFKRYFGQGSGNQYFNLFFSIWLCICDIHDCATRTLVLTSHTTNFDSTRKNMWMQRTSCPPSRSISSPNFQLREWLDYRVHCYVCSTVWLKAVSIRQLHRFLYPR